jgi:hypothetical protein
LLFRTAERQNGRQKSGRAEEQNGGTAEEQKSRRAEERKSGRAGMPEAKGTRQEAEEQKSRRAERQRRNGTAKGQKGRKTEGTRVVDYHTCLLKFVIGIQP